MRWLMLLLLLCSQLTWASPFGAKLCKSDPRFKCMRVGGEGWREIKKNKKLHHFIKRINRVNIGLWGTIAIPKDIKNTDLMAVSPFPERMPAAKEKLLIVDLKKLAWGAYDNNGNLLRWGPIAPGKSWCSDVASSCKTVTGKFEIYRKGGAGCKSGKFPLPNGGAPMPYCSFFHKGYALHAGKLPGRPDSHGCVRTYRQDAKWLSQKFLKIGTKVYVRPYKAI